MKRLMRINTLFQLAKGISLATTKHLKKMHFILLFISKCGVCNQLQYIGIKIMKHLTTTIVVQRDNGASNSVF